MDRRFPSELLSRLPLEVELFGSAEAALLLDDHAPPPLAVTVDLCMPGMDGLETLRTLRRKGYDGLIIAVSSGGHHKDLEPLRHAQLFGADHSAAKPVDGGRPDRPDRA